MKFFKSAFETIVLYLHGSDDNKAKRVTCLALVCLLLPQAVPGYFKMVYGYYYAWKNNQAPSSLASAPTPPPETRLSYPHSSTAGERSRTYPTVPRVAKVKHPHYSTIPLPAAAANPGGK